MLSKTAVHAVTALAGRRNGEYAGAGDVAQQIGAPRNYVGKLLKTLADLGLLESHARRRCERETSRDAAQ